MSAPRIAVAALAAVGVAIMAVIGGVGGPSTTSVVLEIDNASGVRQGTPVKVGGAEVGEVAELRLDDADGVLVELDLEDDVVTVGQGARAAISTVNLVGAKFVDLDPGDEMRPLDDGARIPRQRIGVSTELDEVLDLLDAETRTRLEILLNEAGGAFRGRRADLRASIRGLPPFIASVNDLLSDLVSDNGTLERLIVRSDRAVARITSDRAALGRLVDNAGRAMETVSSRRGELRETLARAPGALAELRAFLADLDATAAPLGPAARTLVRAAPELERTLGELRGFRWSARPALTEARRAAPLLTRLGAQATPVASEARPVLTKAATVVADGADVTEAADEGIEDLLGLVQGWARTIQGRDAVGHSFRGHVTITRDLIDSLSRRLPHEGTPSPRRKAPPKKVSRPPTTTPAPAAPVPGGGGKQERPTPEVLRPVEEALERPLEQLGGILDGVVSGLGAKRPPAGAPPTDRQFRHFLDFLLAP